MRLSLIALITALCAFQAAPAQAQSLNTILDVITTGTSISAGQSNSCGFYRGASKLNCEVRQARYQIGQVEALNRRARQERAEKKRRENLQAGQQATALISPYLLQNCSFRDRASCTTIGMQPEEAAQQLAQLHGTKTALNSSFQFDAKNFGHQILRRNCNIGDQAACAVIGR